MDTRVVTPAAGQVFPQAQITPRRRLKRATETAFTSNGPERRPKPHWTSRRVGADGAEPRRGIRETPDDVGRLAYPYWRGTTTSLEMDPP